jgi:hypothetical protein
MFFSKKPQQENEEIRYRGGAEFHQYTFGYATGSSYTIGHPILNIKFCLRRFGKQIEDFSLIRN